MATVGLIDYGAGNFASVLNALQYLGLDVERVSLPEHLARATHVILPGVGAFAAAMRRLEASGLVDALREAVLGRARPFLGICVGMQLLADAGHEFGTCPGLGWIGGSVERIEAEPAGLRLPHIGWNSLEIRRGSPLFAGLGDAPTFYFLHSYHLRPAAAEATLATCRYGIDVASVVARGNVFGVQFHPEKSQRDGLKLLANFAAV